MTRFGGPERDFDGLGQSWTTDILWLWRFRQCRRREIEWNLNPEAFERAATILPRLRDFGNATYATAQVSKQTWIIREAYFHGWPDPPRFTFFAMEADHLWAAGQFVDWPENWRLNEGHT